MAQSVARSDLSAATQDLLTAVGNNPINKLLKLAKRGSENGNINDEIVSNCWEAFGSYIARILRSGKGVSVPKFGNFTFTSSKVDLAIRQGTTNPSDRDKQERNPLFVISKQFLPSGKPLRIGQQHQSGIRPTDVKGINGAIPLTKITYVDIALMAGVSKDVCRLSLQRIFNSISARALKGENIRFQIPHVGALSIKSHIAAVVFTHDLLQDVQGRTIRVHTNKLFANDVTRNNLKVVQGHHNLLSSKGLVPQVIKQLSTKGTPYFSNSTPKIRAMSHQRSQKVIADNAVRTIDNFFSNTETNTPIAQKRRPLTASRTLQRNQSAGLKTTRTSRAPTIDRQYLDLLLQNSSKLRFQFKQQDHFGNKRVYRAEFEQEMMQLDCTEHAMNQLSLLIKMTRCEDGKHVRYDQFFEKLPIIRNEMKFQNSPIKGQNFTLTAKTERRPLSSTVRHKAYSKKQDDISEGDVFNLATAICYRRQALIQGLLKIGVNLRIKQTPSEIFSNYKKTQLFSALNVHVINKLMKQLGLINQQAGAASATILQFLKRCKNFVQNGGRYTASYNFDHDSQISQSGRAKRALDGSDLQYLKQLIQKLKDQFYSDSRTLKQIFNSFATFEKGSNQSFLDQNSFGSLVLKYIPGVGLENIRALFLHCNQQKSQKMDFVTFEKVFKWKIPYGDWETVALHKLKHWLYDNKLTALEGFNKLLKHAQPQSDANINYKQRVHRSDFIRALKAEGFSYALTAPQIDILFRSLDPDGDGYIDFKKFEQKLFGATNEINGTPLQNLRQTIIQNQIAADDILRRMKLHIWDGPFDFQTFVKHMRFLQPQLSNNGLKKIFKQLSDEDGKLVDLQVLLKNLTGEAYETVQFKNTQMQQIYDHLQKKRAMASLFEKLCEKEDKQNLGSLSPAEFKNVLLKLELPFQEISIEHFIRQLPKDRTGRLNYLKIIEKIQNVGNKNHNPLRSIVQRIAKFLSTNNYGIQQLIRLLGGDSDYGVSLQVFSEFLQRKVDKTRPLQQLMEISDLIDVDKDGKIDQSDLQTCLNNLGSLTFFKKGGKALEYGTSKKFFPVKGFENDQHLSAVCSTIKNALQSKRAPIHQVFHKIDLNHDGLISFPEFNQGMDNYVQLSQAIKEKLFATMDIKSLGVIDFDTFCSIIQSGTFALKRKQAIEASSDNFKWQEEVIARLKEWIRQEKLSYEQAFKNFDHDFDGLVGKRDLKWGLKQILKYEPSQFNDIKIDRLIMLLDSGKRGSLRLQDFARLGGGDFGGLDYLDLNNSIELGGVSYHQKSAPGVSFAPNFNSQENIDWKQHAKQQIGLKISKSFPSIQASFQKATQRRCDKVTYNQFVEFLNQLQALKGFNITSSLLRELFGSIDPHKKGFLSKNDWINNFSGFNWGQQTYDELKSSILGSFSDVNQAFKFFTSFKQGNAKSKSSIVPHLNFSQFKLAINSLTSKRFTPSQINKLWSLISTNNQTIDQATFYGHFSGLMYRGRATNITPSRTDGRRLMSALASAARSKV